MDGVAMERVKRDAEVMLAAGRWALRWADWVVPVTVGLLTWLMVPANWPAALGGLVGYLAATGVLVLRAETPQGRALRAWCREQRAVWPVLVGVRKSLEASGLGKNLRVSAVRSGAGVVVSIVTPRGVADDSVASRCPVLASDLGAWRVSPVRAERHGVTSVLVQADDPLALPLTEAWPLLDAQRWNLAEPIPIGITEDGGTAALRMWAQTVLVAGSPGSGKSVLGWLPLLGAAMDPTTLLVVVDLKPHGIETAPLGARADYAAHDPMAAHLLFQRVWALIDERNALLRARQADKVPEDERVSFPPVFIVVDEAAELGFTDEGAEALRLLQRIVAVGRASGVSVLLLTQKPDAQTIPSNLRDLFAQRVSFRVGNRAQAETILGVIPDGCSPWAVSPETPGVGFALGGQVDGRPVPGGRAVRFRSYFLDRKTIKQRAYAAAQDRAWWLEQHPQAAGLPPIAAPEPGAQEPDSRRARRRRS